MYMDRHQTTTVGVSNQRCHGNDQCVGDNTAGVLVVGIPHQQQQEGARGDQQQQQQVSLCGTLVEPAMPARRPSFTADDTLMNSTPPHRCNSDNGKGDRGGDYDAGVVAIKTTATDTDGTEEDGDADDGVDGMKWRALVLVCMLGLGGCFNYDFPGAIGTGEAVVDSSSSADAPAITTIQALFNSKGLVYNQKMNQSLYSVYSYPNMFFGIVAGLLIDKIIGIRKSIIIFQLMTFTGITITAFAVFFTYYPAMLLGRVVFGMGSETMWLIQSATISRWFTVAKKKTKKKSNADHANTKERAVMCEQQHDVEEQQQQQNEEGEGAEKSDSGKGGIAFGCMLSATRLNSSFAYWALPRLAALSADSPLVGGPSSSSVLSPFYAIISVILGPIYRRAGGVGVALSIGMVVSGWSVLNGVALALYDKLGYAKGAIKAKSAYDIKLDEEEEAAKKKELMMVGGIGCGADPTSQKVLAAAGHTNNHSNNMNNNALILSIAPHFLPLSSHGSSSASCSSASSLPSSSNAMSPVGQTAAMANGGVNDIFDRLQQQRQHQYSSSSSAENAIDHGPAAATAGTTAQKKEKSPSSSSSFSVTLSRQWADLKSLPPSFWLLCAIAVLCYGSALPFIGIAKNIFEVKYASPSGGDNTAAGTARGGFAPADAVDAVVEDDKDIAMSAARLDTFYRRRDDGTAAAATTTHVHFSLSAGGIGIISGGSYSSHPFVDDGSVPLFGPVVNSNYHVAHHIGGVRSINASSVVAASVLVPSPPAMLSSALSSAHHFIQQEASSSSSSDSNSNSGMSESSAALLVSIFQIICATTSPLIGALLDKTGRGPMWLAVASGLMGFTSLALVVLPASVYPPLLPTVTMALGYSFFCATLWPFIPLACPQKLHGLGYGLLAAIDNCGMATVPLIGGVLLDSYQQQQQTAADGGGGGDNTNMLSSLPPFAAYQRVLLLHASLQLTAMAASIALIYVDERYNKGILNARPCERAAKIAAMERQNAALREEEERATGAMRE